jgi:hypothetical protein
MGNVMVKDVRPTWLSYIAISPTSQVFATPPPPAEMPKAHPPEDYVIVDVYAGRITHLLSNLHNPAFGLSEDIKSYIPFEWREEPPNPPGLRPRLMKYENRPISIASCVSILTTVESDHTAVHAVDSWTAGIELHSFVGITPTRVLVLAIQAKVGFGEILSFAYHVTVTSPLAYPTAPPLVGTAKMLMGRKMQNTVDFITPDSSETPI